MDNMAVYNRVFQEYKEVGYLTDDMATSLRNAGFVPSICSITFSQRIYNEEK